MVERRWCKYITLICFLGMLLGNSVAQSIVVANYQMINNTCYEIVGNTSTRVNLSLCRSAIEETQPQIILYEKSSTGRCYTDADCPVGTVCDNAGECTEPTKPNDLTIPGIIIIVFTLFLLLKFK